MPCYIWRNKEGKITAYDQTSGHRPPPAIEVSIDDFKKLGFYQEPISAVVPDEPIEEPQSPADAILEGINSV